MNSHGGQAGLRRFAMIVTLTVGREQDFLSRQVTCSQSVVTAQRVSPMHIHSFGCKVTSFLTNHQYFLKKNIIL